jgi:membrane-associated phospholipid phosphatase
MGAAGPLALLTFIVGIEAMILLPILIIVGWSRIKLKVHTLMEVIAGAFLSFVSVYIQLILFLNDY